MYIVHNFFQEWVIVIKEDYFVINQRIFLVTFLKREKGWYKKRKTRVQ